MLFIREGYNDQGYKSTMLRIPVDSTTMKSVGYDPQKRILEIEFQARKFTGIFPCQEKFFSDSFPLHRSERFSMSGSSENTNSKKSTFRRLT